MFFERVAEKLSVKKSKCSEKHKTDIEDEAVELW